MAERPDDEETAAALTAAIGRLIRRLRQLQAGADLPMPQRAALARIDRFGPATSAELARGEQISPQSMGATLRALEDRGLVKRTADPADRRRVVMRLTRAGADVLQRKRSARAAKLGEILAADFTDAEVRRLAAAVPLLERLADRVR